MGIKVNLKSAGDIRWFLYHEQCRGEGDRTAGKDDGTELFTGRLDELHVSELEEQASRQQRENQQGDGGAEQQQTLYTLYVQVTGRDRLTGETTFLVWPLQKRAGLASCTVIYGHFVLATRSALPAAGQI